MWLKNDRIEGPTYGSWKNFLLPEKHDGTQHPNSYRGQWKHFKNEKLRHKDDKQKPTVQTVEAVQETVADETAKID